jgi:uncharacterized membrane protein YeaQ/YmgE (transglycosylase-associated protein family)
MGIISWIVIGLIAGIIAKLIVGDRLGWIMTILLGIIGAFVGGYVFGLFGGPSVSGFNLISIVVAAVGAIIVLVIYNLISRRR